MTKLSKIKEFYGTWRHLGIGFTFTPMYWRLDKEYTNWKSEEDKTFHVFYISVGLGPFTVSVFN